MDIMTINKCERHYFDIKIFVYFKVSIHLLLKWGKIIPKLNNRSTIKQIDNYKWVYSKFYILASSYTKRVLQKYKSVNIFRLKDNFWVKL